MPTMAGRSKEMQNLLYVRGALKSRYISSGLSFSFLGSRVCLGDCVSPRNTRVYFPPRSCLFVPGALYFHRAGSTLARMSPISLKSQRIDPISSLKIRRPFPYSSCPLSGLNIATQSVRI